MTSIEWLRRRHALTCGVGLCLAGAAGAQDGSQAPSEVNLLGLPAASLDEPMETDRPDFTEGTQTVPYGRLQFEMGYTYAFNDDDGVETTTHTAPEALVRIGLIEDVELRIGWDGHEWVDVQGDGGGADGYTDMDVGFKIRALDQNGLVPHLAFIPTMTIPVGSDTKSADQVDPSIIIAAAYDLPHEFSLGANLGLAGVSDIGGDRFLETSVSVALGRPITDWLGAYVEYYAIFPDDPDGEDEHVLDAGLTFPVQSNLQFDIRAGYGLSHAADDWFVGAGFALRF